MSTLRFCSTRLSVIAWLSLCLAGCAVAFNHRAAQEVSREALARLADDGSGDHLEYEGSDRAYHYVFDNREGKSASYKVRSDQFRLQETFSVGEDSYVLHPWLIDGKRLGSKPDYAN